ncbi:MAG: VOC family protein [Acidobacteriaceae bacterium]
MPHTDRHPAGHFVWLELATTSQSAAKNFYSALFGWEAQDAPMGPDAVYTMFRLNSRDVSGAFQISAEEHRIPPHWQLYVAVDNADTAASRAAELGAKIIQPPMDIPNVGRMAVLQDPTGAMLSVFQPGVHKGMGITGEPGAFCWADLQTRDRTAATHFYGSLFGWEFTLGKDKDPSGYLHIRSGEQHIGGIPGPGTLPPHVPPHWLAYIQVADCAAVTARAQSLGASILLPPMTIENQLRFSVLADPQGAAFALFQPAH